MTTPRAAGRRPPGGVPTLANVRDWDHDDDGGPDEWAAPRRWPRLMVTVSGTAVAAVITMFIVQSGGTASVTEGTASAPRTVIATAAPVVPQAASEVPVLVQAGAQPQAQPRVDLRQVVYTVAGNQRPDDPVTVVYTDETGTLQKAENVALPWTLTITPDLPVSYVTASSRGSQLNCWITDAAGNTVVSRTDFSPSTTCNR